MKLNYLILFGNNFVLLLLNFLSFTCNLFHYWRLLIVYIINQFSICRFKEDHPDFVGAKLIYAPARSVDRKGVEYYIKTLKKLKKMYPNFVAGFDLVGQEDLGHTLEYFVDLLKDIGQYNISFFFHAGETNWLGTSTDENLVDAILLNTRRIGHG